MAWVPAGPHGDIWPISDFPCPEPWLFGEHVKLRSPFAHVLALSGLPAVLEETSFIFLEWQYTSLNVSAIIFIDLSGFLYGQK